MKKRMVELQQCLLLLLAIMPIACKEKKDTPATGINSDLNLKRGKVISCGPAGKELGTVQFDISCTGAAKEDFDLGLKLLHSFEYDEAEKAFAKLIDEQPGCAMAYWGVAMSNFHPLWAPPSEAELKKGLKAIEIARGINPKTKREENYINAIAAFYEGWEKIDHRSRCINFEKAMEKLYTEDTNDKEAGIFYALALDAAADPADKTFKNQKKAGSILTALYPLEPNHPGIVHYIIHTYDYPGLAQLALDAARKYATVAPSSAHALHMPSHIFTRLGLWEECIRSNLEATASAKCYAESSGIKGHWDEELHGLDYLVYAYLQRGDNKKAKEQWDYLRTINDVSPANFKVFYAFASIPSRYLLENKLWKEAAVVEIYPEKFAWEKFPWQKAIIHFARLLGSVHTGNMDAAYVQLKELNTLRDTLLAQKDPYKANQVNIQITLAGAWIRFKEGKNKEALDLAILAADMEDKTEKHSVTPGEVIPAKELLGDLLLEMNKPADALVAYEADLEKHPNRFNGIYGAGLAAERSGDKAKAAVYYRQLIKIAEPGSDRPELQYAKRHT